MNRKKRFYNIFRISVLMLIGVCFTNCNNKNNEKIIDQFEYEFGKAILENKAKTFEYLYDGLVPQDSYFINSKLKYLKFRHEPENGSIESLVYFDNKTDSIKKIIRRQILFEWDDAKNQKTENYTDTIFVILFDKKETYTYVNNQIVDSSFIKSVFDRDKNFIKKIKIETEKNYNSR
jgi:hypothetical protein